MRPRHTHSGDSIDGLWSRPESVVNEIENFSDTFDVSLDKSRIVFILTDF